LSSQWFFNHRGHLQGPLSEAEIIQKIQSQELGADDLVFRSGESKWRPLSEIAIFALEVKKLSAEEKSSAEDSGREWVLLVKGKEKKRVQKGPFSVAEIRDMLRVGKLKVSDYVWRKGMKEWYRLQSFPEFFEEKKSAPPVPSSSDVSDLLKNVLELQQASVPPELPPTEAHGPDLVKAKKDPREEAEDLIKTRVGFRLPPKAKAQAIATRKFRLSFVQKVALGAFVLIIGSGLVLRHHFGRLAEVLESTEGKRKVSAPAPTSVPRPVIAVPAVTTAPRQQVVAPSAPSPTPESKRPPSYLRVDRLGDKIRLSTDASSHFSATLEFASEVGQIVGAYSQHRILQRSEREIDLSALKWPRAYYRVEARIGDQKAETRVFVGGDEAGFAKDLSDYNKSLTYKILEERIEFIRTSERVLSQVRSFERILSRAGDSKAWQRDYGPWRTQFLKTKRGTLKSIQRKNRNNYVLAPIWWDLKSQWDEFDRFTKSLARKSQREDLQVMVEYRERAKALSEINENMQNFSLWR
jgi:hypothetical protein